MKTSPSQPITPTAAARRQANYRTRAFALYGVRPVTLLLTSAEERYLRTAFYRHYGHAPSVGARVAHAAQPNQQQVPRRAAQVGQLDLL